MKTEKSPILVIFCIFLLLSFIVVPPIFRKYIPKEDHTNMQNKNQNHILILTCSKIYVTEKMNVTSKTKYINHEPIHNVVSYENIIEEKNIESTEEEETNQISVTEELQALLSLKNVKSTTNDKIVTVTIDKTLLQQNENNQTLNSYLQGLTGQKKSYENKGFSCTTMES